MNPNKLLVVFFTIAVSFPVSADRSVINEFFSIGRVSYGDKLTLKEVEKKFSKLGPTRYHKTKESDKSGALYWDLDLAIFHHNGHILSFFIRSKKGIDLLKKVGLSKKAENFLMEIMSSEKGEKALGEPDEVIPQVKRRTYNFDDGKGRTINFNVGNRLGRSINIKWRAQEEWLRERKKSKKKK